MRELYADSSFGLGQTLMLRALIHADQSSLELAREDAALLQIVADNNARESAGSPLLEKSTALYVRLLAEFDATTLAELRTTWEKYLVDNDGQYMDYKYGRIARYLEQHR